MSEDIEKKPFKMLEIAVNNFQNVAIPYHQTLYEERMKEYTKVKNDMNKARITSSNIKRSIGQLRDLQYELKTLRTQVEDVDLEKFDDTVAPIHKLILQILCKNMELSKMCDNVKPILPEEQNEPEISPTRPIKLNLEVNINELKLQEKEARLQNVESLQTDIQDVHSMYGTLHGMVHEQGENVDIIENNVDDAQINVSAGARHVSVAASLKASTHPIAGAIIGTCIGGPIGLIAGLKIGGIAALSCSVLGYTGGRFLKKINRPKSVPNNTIHKDSKKDD